MNLLFSSLSFFMLMPFISMSLFTADRQFYLADISAKLYHPSAYYVAKVRTADAIECCTSRMPHSLQVCAWVRAGEGIRAARAAGWGGKLGGPPHDPDTL
jgi:hypothetical protein